jgi:exonuclease SbcC
VRPVKLELEGFTSFRSRTELDFQGLTMFAITGPTGAGKTSILDAIVYALYGRTPRLNDDIRELISQGAGTMRVALEFQAGGTVYKVMRVFGRKTDIRLERRDAGEWRPVADKVRQVNELIAQILGLDFNGFTRSVLLPQGEFDEFLRGEPAARTKILTQLMGLQIYREMRVRAWEHRNRFHAQLSIIEGQLSSAYGEATEERRQDLESRLAGASRGLSELRSQIARLNQLQPPAMELREQRNRRRAGEQSLEVAGQRLTELRKQAEQASKNVEKCREQVTQLETEIRECGYDEAMHLRLTEAAEIADQHGNLAADIKQRRGVIAGRHSALPALETAVRTCERELADRANQSAEAQRSYDQLQRELDEAVSKYGSVDRIKQAIADLESAEREREEQHRLAGESTKLKEQEKNLHDEQKALAAKLEKLQQSAETAETQLEHFRRIQAAGDLRKHLEAGQPCPVCEQIVHKRPATLKTKALDQAKAERDAAVKRVEECKHAILTGQQKLAAIPERAALLESMLAKAKRTIDGATEKARTLLGKPAGDRLADELKGLAAGLAKTEKQAANARSTLDRAREAERSAQQKASEARNKLEPARQAIQIAEEELRLRLANLDELSARLEEFADLGDNPRKRLVEQQAAKKRRDQLDRDRRAAVESVNTALEQQSAYRDEIILWTDRAKHTERQIREATEAIARMEPGLRAQLSECDLKDVQDEAAWLTAHLGGLTETSHRLIAEEAGLKKDLDQVIKLIADAAEKRRQADDLQAQSAVYEELSRHLDTNRLPEFIQRRALSQLVGDATRQLESLSSGRYALALAESDNNFCVIDHWNADDPRPVSTLSGGESFLASLALALALAGSLSPYCANRDRLQLDSLFLDEGFSTLDPETLDLVVGAIETLRGDNRMVGIISHVPELAARLDERVCVEKSIGGSTIRIERGQNERHFPTRN